MARYPNNWYNKETVSIVLVKTATKAVCQLYAMIN